MSQRNSRTIYVGNLPGDIHEREVEDLFYEYGPIIDIDMKIPPRPLGYAFIEFEDPRDTEDAIRGRDGYNFDGHKLRVELAHGGRNQSSSLDRHRSYNSGGHRGGASRRTEYRVMITGLPAFASWQDLKDHMRQAGDVCFSEVFDIGQGTIGIVDYTNYDDMQCAIKKLDDSEFRNAFSRAYIRVVEYDSERSLSRSRSPSRSYSRSVSPTHSRSRSRSRSKSPKAQSSRHPLSSSRSRSASSRSHSISRFGLKQESLDWILGSGSHFSSSTFIEDKTQENRERMPKKKDGQSENANSNKANNQCLWNKIMDDALIDAYLNQHNTGNRVDGTFTIHAFENIVNELKEKFPDKLIDKDKVQNRMKHIKRDWFSCYDIFKNSMSGFAWDPITEFFSAEPEAWQQLIEIKPAATEWKSKPIRNYEKLVQLYGKDNATGQHANTALEIQKRRASMEVENNIGENQFETIDEVGFIISQQEIHLDNSNAINEDVQIPTPSSEPTKSQANSFVGASLKNKSAKKGKVDDDNISKAIDHVAQAIMSSTHEMVKSNELPIPENEVWSLLTQLGVEQYRISKCYLYLVQRPKMVRALLGCPFEYRKDLVFQMMDEENILHD